MAQREIYRVLPTGDGNWKVKKNGAIKASKVYSNKDNAIDRGKELAKKARLGQIVIHKSDGTIQTEYTYGKDPTKYKG